METSRTEEIFLLVAQRHLDDVDTERAPHPWLLLGYEGLYSGARIVDGEVQGFDPPPYLLGQAKAARLLNVAPRLL